MRAPQRDWLIIPAQPKSEGPSGIPPVTHSAFHFVIEVSEFTETFDT